MPRKAVCSNSITNSLFGNSLCSKQQRGKQGAVAIVQTSFDQLGGGGVALIHQPRLSASPWCSLITDFLCGLLTLIWCVALLVGRLSYRGLARLEGLGDLAPSGGRTRNDILTLHVGEAVSATLQGQEASTFSRNIICIEPIQVHDANDNLPRGGSVFRDCVLVGGALVKMHRDHAQAIYGSAYGTVTKSLGDIIPNAKATVSPLSNGGLNGHY